eukprot:GHVQ01036409.1.p1 GENE.GHVQ01036409.1~~GHVQ01036409.1.p1  ORF type:complete len:164 (-),score=27.00 GHVQ01036409.1:15-506(-)
MRCVCVCYFYCGTNNYINHKQRESRKSVCMIVIKHKCMYYVHPFHVSFVSRRTAHVCVVMYSSTLGAFVHRRKSWMLYCMVLSSTTHLPLAHRAWPHERTHIHPHTYIHTQTHTHDHTHKHSHTNTHTSTHTLTFTHKHTHMHSHTNTHTRTHTHPLIDRRSC